MYKIFIAIFCRQYSCVRPNLILKMKLTAIIWIIALMQVSASSHGQNITLNLKNVPFEKFLDRLEQQSKYHFLYDNDLMSKANPVTLKANGLPLEKVLAQSFMNQPFTYVFKENNVIITRISESTNINTPFAAVSGIVTDDKKNPLPGVNVRIKDTQIRTTTNNQGRYNLPDVKNGAILQFSFVGYELKEVPANGQNTINVVLSLFEDKLNEVSIVAVGYGTVNRKDLTGSVGSVNMTDIKKAPVINVLDGLAGRVAGVQVNSIDGQPGSIANITIRGSNSLTQSSAPLYVVDGFPLEDAAVNSINQADIETIDILKDASSTAIYGARGANGVVVITTKKGVKGAPIVTFNSYYGMQKNLNRMEMMNTRDFVAYQLQVNPTQNTPIYINTAFPNADAYKDVPAINLQDQLFQTGSIQNNDLSIRGGNENTLYSISGNYIDQKGIIITSGFKRYQGRITLDQKINNKFKVGVNANYGYSVASGTTINNPGVATGLSTTNGSAGILYSTWAWRPTLGVTGSPDILEESEVDPVFSLNSNIYNPITDIENQLRKTSTTNLFVNGYVEYKILPNLTLRSTVGITTNNSKTDAFYNSKTYYGKSIIPGRTAAGNGVSGSINNSGSTSFSNENTITYDKLIQKYHKISILAGATLLQSKTNNYGFSTTHIPTDFEGLGLNSLNLAPTLWSPTGASYTVNIANSSISTLASFLGRVNYSYKSKYLFTGNFRADGSSKFAPGNRWGYFSAGALAWRIINEEFMKPINFISDAKLRTGYGVTGNNRVGDFAYLPALSFASPTNLAGYTYNNQAFGSGAVIGSIGNPLLQWEKTAMTSVGLDLGFFKQRIQLTVDWYKKMTNDLLLNANVPTTTGVGTAIQNVGKMQNDGLEFTLSTVNIKSKDFTWESSFNINFNNNKLVSLTDGASFLTLPSGTITGIGQQNSYNSMSPYISIVGKPVGQMYGVIFDGLYQYSDFDKMPNGTYKLKAGVPYYSTAATPQPGWAKYKDINNDGVINNLDWTIIGRGLPIHTGGFSNNFSYKGFDLNLFFQWSYGNDLLNANRMVFEAPGDVTPTYINLMATMADRWSPTNQSSNIPIGSGTNYIGFNSRVIEDGSFLRLKTVSLGYNLPSSVLKTIKVRSIRAYATAQNLYTWTNYTGQDPDVSVKRTVQSPGFDLYAYPMPRTVVFGLNVTL